jgi:hypothetical protein
MLLASTSITGFPFIVARRDDSETTLSLGLSIAIRFVVFIAAIFSRQL